MRLLLDTHVLLWTLSDPDRLRPDARAAVSDPLNRLFASACVVWEIAIKVRLGKLSAPDDLPDHIESLGVSILPVTVDHAWAVRELPLLHGDPFDRMIVAQALIEDMVLVTRDRMLGRYGVEILTA